MASPSPAANDAQIVDRLVAATAQRQLYRIRGRDGGSQALLLLPRAFASAPGWAERLSALALQGGGLRPGGAIPFTRAGAVADAAALSRPWLDGIGARTFAKSKVDGLPPLLVVLALVDAATALAELHAAGLRHGGVAPESAILGSDGRLVLVDIGLWPALTGKPGSEAQDIRDFGRMAYRWLAGRDVPGDRDEPPPADLPPPSRLDRRVPAQVDPLVLRALRAGGSRGLARSGELVQGLRQVLRAAGAAVSPADIVSWAQKHPSEVAPSAGVSALLSPGQAVVWGPLVEKAASGTPEFPFDGEPDTVRDVPVIPIAPSLRPPRLEPFRSAVEAPAPSEPSRPSLAGATHVSHTSASVVAERRRDRWRRFGGLFLALAAAGGALAVYATVSGRPRRGMHEAAPSPAALLEPPAPARIAPPPTPPPPQYQPPPLPVYDEHAPPPRPKPSAAEKRAGRERAERRAFGRGAFLSVEASRVARVVLDGHDTHRLTPLRRLPIAPGPHRLRLVGALGHGSAEFRFVARKGREVYRYGNLAE